MRTAALILLAATWPGVALAEPPSTMARIGRSVMVDGPRVTPLAVLEDSRCPAKVQCIWAGRVRLKVRITLGTRSEVRELTLGTPAPVADGSLELTSVTPSPRARLKPRDYRFGLRFMGGL